jgi:hypothetical protein
VTTLTYSGLDLLPSAKTADLLPPVTTLTPLPEWSLYGGLDVNWSSMDVGGAGVRDHQFESRESGGWIPTPDWFAQTSTYYYPSNYNEVCFRARARDNAFNIELYDPLKVECTRFFLSRFSGKITDNRAYPIPYADLVMTHALNDLQVDDQGDYAIYLSTYTGQFDADHAGYGNIPATELWRNRSMQAWG